MISIYSLQKKKKHFNLFTTSDLICILFAFNFYFQESYLHLLLLKEFIKNFQALIKFILKKCFYSIY